MAYVGGESRTQGALFPVALDDLVGEDHAVRVIDAFVGKLDLGQLGFQKARPAATGRPPYDPGDLLRLYLYGYLNQVRSSRRLERECRRNVEVMWLLNRLAPDHKTIADFRRVNASPFKAVCRSFVRFCAEAELIGGQWVAIDGSKLQAVASKRAVVARADLKKELEALDGQVQKYLEALDAADALEGEAAGNERNAVRQALARLQERRADVASTEAILKELGETHHVAGEPDAKLVKTADKAWVAGYNVQTAVDAKYKLVVHHEVTNEAADQRSLLPMATGAKDVLGSDTLKVVADAGYQNGEQAQACEQTGITPYVPVKRAQNHYGEGKYFDRSAFTYDKHSDSYRCPAGQTLTRVSRGRSKALVLYTTKACGGCALKAQCTGASQRWVTRHVAEEAIVRMQARMRAFPEAMVLRRSTAEHPFANLKYRVFDNGRFLLRGMAGVRAEMALAVLAYNFRRAMNLLGGKAMREKLAGAGA